MTHSVPTRRSSDLLHRITMVAQFDPGAAGAAGQGANGQEQHRKAGKSALCTGHLQSPSGFPPTFRERPFRVKATDPFPNPGGPCTMRALAEGDTGSGPETDQPATPSGLEKNLSRGVDVPEKAGKKCGSPGDRKRGGGEGGGQAVLHRG